MEQSLYWGKFMIYGYLDKDIDSHKREGRLSFIPMGHNNQAKQYRRGKIRREGKGKKARKDK